MLLNNTRIKVTNSKYKVWLVNKINIKMILSEKVLSIISRINIQWASKIQNKWNLMYYNFVQELINLFPNYQNQI